jgi:hypothetical protein
MNPVVHFEMPYNNRERMAEFYHSAFGWQTRLLGEEMGNYVHATTTETNDNDPKNREQLMVASTRPNPIGQRNIRPLLSP